jgi:hypothetical protein
MVVAGVGHDACAGADAPAANSGRGYNTGLPTLDLHELVLDRVPD